jgi:acetate kinase
VFHYASDAGKLSPASTAQLHISKAEEILNKHCGWSALTGTTDFAKIAASRDPQCVLAFQLLVDRIAGFIGSYYVSLQGQVDALVFAGGIGEKSASLRAAVSERVSCLGFAIDKAANEELLKDPGAKVVANITDANRPSSILVCRTDEQFEMARTCTSREELWSEHGT